MYQETNLTGYQTPKTAQALPHRLEKIWPNLDHVKAVMGESLLDVGCGHGYVYDYLKPKKYLGIDYYQEQIDAAREAHPDVAFQVGDVFNLDVEPFDTVLCSRLLIHLPNFNEAMQNLLRVAKKNCAIIVKVGEDRIQKEEEGFYSRWFSEETLRSAGECVILECKSYATVIYDR